VATPGNLSLGDGELTYNRVTPNERNSTDMSMYPEIMVVPMREELTRLGIEELKTPEDVDRAVKSRPGTTMVVVNSICGCAAGRMRPAVRMALQNSIRPDHAYSVFAGQEKEATDRARSYFTGYPPSSPSIAILRDGELVYMMQRRDIESREAPAIAADLKAAFDRICGKPVPVQS
jgi:putative YphP/YqiW family bacilliredoxin